jgi:hypothetical protein
MMPGERSEGLERERRERRDIVRMFRRRRDANSFSEVIFVAVFWDRCCVACV